MKKTALLTLMLLPVLTACNSYPFPKFGPLEPGEKYDIGIPYEYEEYLKSLGIGNKIAWKTTQNDKPAPSLKPLDRWTTRWKSPYRHAGQKDGKYIARHLKRASMPPFLISDINSPGVGVLKPQMCILEPWAKLDNGYCAGQGPSARTEPPSPRRISMSWWRPFPEDGPLSP